MKFFPIVCFSILILSSCAKGKESCTAYTANDEEMYTVDGADICQEQISEENGEFCICAL